MKPKMLIPMLVCRDAAKEMSFCKSAFGAVELSRREAKDGSIVHATLSIHESMIMIHDASPHLGSIPPQQDGSSPVVNYLYCEDADESIKKAVAAGARVLMPAENTFWGDRVGRIIDPSGHVWNIAARMAG
jgi:PhnB protein